ncbi:unnamed protein product [Caenorhabditis auriculariae]|uniref:Renin receptor-like C-terminal transmembrane spanning segment domain-containing protein n=1 Tax=Caenorhabditis auriculariae TaxID=2777116 RepID=A0A8S1GW72_9PELO|nr:unnamed protein product [Caenorhabditis auriculariae]
MRVILALAALIATCSGSSLEILSAPTNVVFPSSASTLRSTQLSPLNAYLLGLSARPVEGFNVQTDLFSRPRALAIVRVNGVDALTNPAKSYQIDVDGFDNVGLEQDLSLVFGADRQVVQLNAGGITGSELAQKAQSASVDTSAIKTSLTQLRSELEAVLQLASAIKSQGAKLSNSADVYRVTIGGLATATGISKEDRQVALKDIQSAVEKLNEALVEAYGGQALVEVVAVSSFVVETEGHHIVKRAIEPVSDSDKRLKTYRERYMVYSVTYADYPAIFAIFFGLVVILVVALVYIVVGMMTMDPGKDSIIYRMTTTRMKRD